jgi:hypothetical protein
MCYSATASFVASGVLGTVGLATLRHVREPRALLFAAVPLLFAFHQFTEGFVWLGLEGRIGPSALKRAAFLFMGYAQGVLPFLMPLAVLLIEPPGRRRRAILALTVLGAVVAALMMYGLIVFESRCFIERNSIAYRNPVTGNLPLSLLYILGTCGSLLLSTHRTVRWYGVLNVIALTITQIVREYAFASVWCFYAATMSIVIYWQFARKGIDVETPNGTSPILRPFLFPWMRLTGSAVRRPGGRSDVDR